MLNKEPARKCVASLVSNGPGFFDGVCGQKILLNQFAPNVDHVLIVERGAYPPEMVDYLRKIGWLVHELPALRTKKTEFAASRWPFTFTKLHLWNLLDYDRVVYLDADAVPDKKFDELFSIKLNKVGATTGACKTRFRSGMMVLEPSAEIFSDLIALLEEDPIKNAAKLGDQGVLNVYFNKQFTSLPQRYNQCDWSQSRPDTVIAHVRPKPWEDKRAKVPALHPYVASWKAALSHCHATYGKPAKMSSKPYFISRQFERQTLQELKRTIRPAEAWKDIDADAQHHLKLIGVPTKPCRVLEIGCGIGRLLKPLSKLGFNASGVDASKSMIQEARKYAPAAKTVQCPGDGSLPYDGNNFDFVFSIITFQHIPNTETVERYIHEASRVLSAEGRFHFQVFSKPQPRPSELTTCHSHARLRNAIRSSGMQNTVRTDGKVWSVYECRKVSQ